MAIEWSGYSHNLRLGIDLVGNTMIVYLESNKYGFNFSNGTLSFSGDASGSKTVGFYSGTGQSVREEVHRWSIGTGSYTATVVFNHTIGGVGTISLSKTRTRTVTPKPAAPGLDRVVRTSDTSHRVEWTRNATATSVRLERRTNDGSWQHVSSVESNASSITDTTTKAGNKYQYRVRVANAGGTSDWSNLSNNIYTTPTAPTGVTATRVGNDIRVSMTMPSRSTHLDIQDDGTTVVSALAKGSLPWTHTAPSPVVTHRYRARSRIASGTSDSVTLYSSWSTYSATVQLTAPPSAPTGLSPNGLTVESGSQVSLSWRHAPVDSSEQSAYELRHRLDGGAWTTLSGTTASSRSLTVGAGVVEWQVRTKGAHPDWSPWSAVATVTVVDRPTVAILSPDGGQFFEAVLPVSWSFFQAQGRPQSSWRARLLRDGQLLETKQGTGSATSTTFSTRLEDGHSYTVEVDAASGSIWSAVESVSVAASFILPAPAVLGGVWNDSTGAVDLQVSVLEQPPHADVINYAPRIQGSGEWAEVRRNYCVNPRAEVDLTGWDTVRADLSRLPSLLDSSKHRIVVTVTEVGTLPSGAVCYATLGVGSHIVRVKRDSANLSTKLYVSATLGGTLAQVESMDAEIVLPFTMTVAGTVAIRVGTELGAPVDTAISFTDVYVGQAGEYFDGSTPDFTVDPDMRTRWLPSGASVMEIESVAGFTPMRSIAGLSSRDGAPAVRLIATESYTQPSDAWSYARFTIPAPARSHGTFLGTRHVPTALSPSMPDFTGLEVRGPIQNQLVGAGAGDWDLRRGFTGLTVDFWALLGHGGARGSGDVWYTRLGMFVGDYHDEPFDGDTEWVLIDGVWMHTRWNPDGTSTASMPDDAVSMTVERSIDGGNTWSPVLTDETGVVQVADHEALSNGVTIYRVTTYAVTGAATVREYPVGAYSEAGWLGVGVAHGHTVRLPYSPQISVTAGRERALKRYSGRAKPVVYAGEHVSRTVDTGGMILVNDPDNAAYQEMLEAAQDPEPTALWRDPTGAHVVGMLSDIQVSRQAHSVWGFSFQLEESED